MRREGWRGEKEGRVRKRCLFTKANIPIVCQADRQPWGVQLEDETVEWWWRWSFTKGVGGESEISGL